jgi:hypothetical protein
MTEYEWLACTDPKLMLQFLRSRSMASDRKLRLFAVACCHHLWELLTEPCFRNAVEVAERFADNQARKKELNEAKKVSGAAFANSKDREGRNAAAHRAFGCAWSTTRTPVLSAAMYPTWILTAEADRERQVALLGDLFGNLFRPVTLDASWLMWNAGTVPAIAERIYKEGDWAALPVLADALEDAGCTSADILKHCRGPGPHVRGCWVVDLLLGKE